ncbi:MAG: hypothetical protein H0U95_12210 [Bacteroidetes bacterium]|nr:hypothetical protein [Bacteroidota bacterium]
MKNLFLILLIAFTYKVGHAQDPTKTPKNPRLKTSGTVDGSNGKYVSEHKVHKSEFTKHHLRIKKAKIHSTEKTGKNYISTK